MRALVVGLLSVVLTSGCTLVGDERGEPEEPSKGVDERGMRTDHDPRTRRFPTLDEPVSAQWQSGTLGDDRTAPGPSTVWIDAVITLEPEVASELEHEALDGQTTTPDLVPDVAAEVPEGDLTHVTVAGPDTWQVEGWLVEEQDVLVLSARGQ